MLPIQKNENSFNRFVTIHFYYKKKVYILLLCKIKEIFGGSAEYHGGIRSRIPVGMGKNHSKKQDEKWMPVFGLDKTRFTDFGTDHETFLRKAIEEEYPICSANYDHARKQVGTLGGGK